MDQLDLRLLARLQENARLTNAELARDFGVAPSTMLERIRRLEERGVLCGYRARIAPAAAGFGVSAYVAVSLQSHDKRVIERFEAGVCEVEWVRSCAHVTGRFDYLLQIVARDLAHLGVIIKTDIAAIPGIGKEETFLVLSDVKPDTGLPLASEEPK